MSETPEQFLDRVWPLPLHYTPNEEFYDQIREREPYLIEKHGAAKIQQAHETFTAEHTEESLLRAYAFAYSSGLCYDMQPPVEYAARIATLDTLKQIKTAEKPIIMLDLGCGPGKMTSCIAAQENVVKVYALDIVPEALELTMKNARELGIEHKIESIVADYNDEHTRTRISEMGIDFATMAFPHDFPEHKTIKAVRAGLNKGGQFREYYQRHHISMMDVDYGYLYHSDPIKDAFGKVDSEILDCCWEFNVAVMIGKVE